MYKPIVSSFCIILFSCSGSQHLQPAESDMAVAQQKVPGVTMTDLNDGYKLYVNNCSGCHRLHKPVEFTTAQWEPILNKMFIKAKLVDEKPRDLIRNYVISKSK